MKRIIVWNGRLQSILAFSLLSSYILSFLFEGQILYSLLELYELETSSYIIEAIVANFLGLFSCGLFTKSIDRAKTVMLLGMGTSFVATIPFFFAPSPLWFLGLIVGGYASGVALAAWGYFLKAFTPQQERLKTCADVLIISNVIMVAINVLTFKLSPFVGLTVVMLSLFLGTVFTWSIRIGGEHGQDKQARARSTEQMRNAFLLLCVFIAVLTVNSGLMYQVINPAFSHLPELTVWYWAVPYIMALLVMRHLPSKIKHSRMLYAGMAMMIGAFIGFMLLGRNALDYFAIDTLMLAACGVFDLFWWSILGAMLDYTANPSMVFGVGLSANVLGVLSGGVIGLWARSTQSLTAEVTVMALTIICASLALLPLLNRQLALLLRSHAYLTAYGTMDADQQSAVLYQVEPLDPLTAREEEVLAEILLGKSNREAAAALYITENTMKTHARNIYSKYGVHSRAELISILLKGEDV